MKSTDQINALLPQTQCEACGYKGCKPYAQALANGETTIDLCAPGGVKVLRQLGDLLQIDPTPYLANVEKNYRPPSVAVIDEALCIGCVKCVNACPIDAIVGAAKLMHTIVPDLCSGCGLCVEPCPMDCISMQPLPERTESVQQEYTLQWLEQYDNRTTRLEKNQKILREKQEAAQLKKQVDLHVAKQAAIAEAIARVKAKKNKVEL